MLLNANANYTDLVNHLKLPQSTISFYINSTETRYEILNKEIVIKILISYKQSFLDKLVDRFLEIWFEKFAQNNKYKF